MRIEYSELMERLGVGYILSAYETRPWFLHDSKAGIMCSAEVRVGPGSSDVEAEIQFLHDEDKPPGSDIEEIEEEEEEEEESTEKKRAKHGPKMGQDGPEQIFIMRFLPNKQQEWQGKFLLVRGEPYHTTISNWDERGCAFFCDFIAALQMNELPDIDELIEEHLVDRYRGGRGRRGRVGKKGFKVEQKGLSMGMKG